MTVDSKTLPVSMHPNAFFVRGHVNTPARVIFLKMVERAEAVEAYGKELREWLDGKTSAIELRDLSKPFGDYWSDLDFSNAVDDLDSTSLRFKLKNA